MMLVNAADLTADAYGRRKPKYPVIPETLGLALVPLISRNTARERGVWLAAPKISDALCRPAEAFAEALEQRAPSLGWRGGALASLRSLVPGTLHEVTEPWPVPGSDGTRFPTGRFWVDDDETWYWRDGGPRPPVRRRARGRPQPGRRASATARRTPRRLTLPATPTSPRLADERPYPAARTGTASSSA